jgi:glycosyltransferase involved in cell wall biosynthesis
MSGQPTLPSLTIFFPAFNEEANIKNTIMTALKSASQLAGDYEVICVNDGSTDRTQTVVEELVKNHPKLRLVSHRQNLGYGAAIKTGLASSTKEWIFYTDSDGQFRFDQLAAFIAARTQADMILGYRKKRQDHLLRLVIAKVFLKTWNYLLYGLTLKDVDCSYKLFPRQLIRGVELITESAITETELMVRLIRQGATYLELPVTHYPRYKGIPTGANPEVIIRALKESLILWRALHFK